MATDIDSLQIQINAQASKANDALDKLIGKLDKLTTSLSSVDGSKLYGLANGVQSLGTAMQTMSGVKTSDFTRLANNLTKLNAVDTANFRAISLNVHSLASSLKGLSGVSDSAKQIIELANAIKQLGYKSAEKAIANIPQLAVAVRQLMAELSKAPKVSRNLIDLINALAKLARTGASSGKAATSLSNALNTYSGSARNARTHTFSLASAIGKVYATYWMLFRIAGKVKDAINISSDLTEVQNVVDVTFGEYASLVEDMSKTSITDFGMSELTVKQVSSRFQAMGTAMGFTQGKMADMSIELTKLTADMASFYNVEQSDIAKDLESVFTGQTRPLRTYGLDLTEATLKEWALKQGLDANIDSMSQAEKTMLRYQYVMANTGAAQGDFARTADTWANQVRILKQNIEALGAVMGGAFINMLKPVVKALNVVIGKLREFATAVSNSLGKIFGWKYESSDVGISSDFEDAEDATSGITDNLGSAGEKAKKLKQILLGIDELNVVDQSNSTSSGSGNAGATAGGASSGDQWTKTDGILKEYESELDSLYKLGAFISEKLTDTLNSINWDSIYESARNFGTGLASFLNGLISPELFGAVGKTIAGALNTAIYAALSFGETFGWENLGESIAEGINEFFTTFDFTGLADTLDVWVQGIWKTITTALGNIEWGAVYDGVIEFLEGIDIETIELVIGAIAIKKILGLHLASTALSMIESALSRSIAQAIALKLGVEIAENAGIKAALTAGLTKAFSGIGTTFMAGLKGLLGSEAALSALSFISPITKAVTGIGSVIGGVAIAVSNFFSMWKSGFSWLKEALMVLGVAITAVGAVILGAPAVVSGVVAGIVALIGTITIVIHDNWEAICAFLSQFAEWFNTNIIIPVQKRVKYILLFMKGLWIVASGWFYENVISQIIKLFLDLKSKVEKIFTTLWAAIQKVWYEVSNWYNDTVIVPLLNLFDLIYQTVSNLFSVLWSKIMEIWNGVSKWFNETVISPVQKAFETLTGAIGEVFDGLWKGIKSGVITAMNGAISVVESAVNWIIAPVNDVIDSINSIGNAIEDAVDIDVPNLPNIPRVSLGRIPAYEIGGFPEDGLFMANHNEIIGQFTNGKTAVANNEQITSGISQGVRDAVSDVLVPYLSDIARSTRETANKDFSTNIDGRSLVSEINRRSTRNGFSFT